MKGTNRLRKPGSVKKHLLGRVHSASEVYDYSVKQTQEDINKGLNKKIEDVAKSATEVIGGPCVTINGKDPLDYGEYSASMLEIAAKTVAAFGDIGMTHFYIFSPIDVIFDLTSPEGGDIYFITKDFGCFTSCSMETDAETGEKVAVIGEVGINPESPDESDDKN